MKHFNIEVYGRVQGVGFRFNARNKARELGIKGFVMNRPDGSVYIEAEGEEANCLEFINWCRSGTGYSWVEHLDITEDSLLPHSSFSIRS